MCLVVSIKCPENCLTIYFSFNLALPEYNIHMHMYMCSEQRLVLHICYFPLLSMTAEQPNNISTNIKITIYFILF